MNIYVEIKLIETSEVVERIGPISTIRRAEQVERGVNININHDEYSANIIESESTLLN